jgi:NAD(P)-dependent dehydrogenase (short-subunit alcohol dehydrogenase family)
MPSTPYLYVEIGSRAGVNLDHEKFSLYAMVKQGQIGLLRSLAAEMQGTRCSFLVLSPRGVKTELYNRSLGDRQALKNKFANDPDLIHARSIAEAIIEDVEKWVGLSRHAPATRFDQRFI